MPKGRDYIDCGHKIEWRWKSVGQDGAFCRPCMRVYPVRVKYPVPIRTKIAGLLRQAADRIERN